jgi:RNA recognition motif-containing protein
MNTNNMTSNIPTYSNILFVGDLPKETSEEDLFNLFKPYNISQIKLYK